ncbi:DUF2842 domain-containing protein [Qipengyuania sp. 1NDW9]|uniref:DUF2842 domain-containing protein n=1 Tax=Qipengyuania xiapuensis TaxID=2867236 RepID=A0ABX8ZXR9_9SPHN|nr:MULTISPECIES: DUF2842 domain-containing protein [Qipengyuania]MBX7493449.1 DUF2842 domain-containing protein [Qipengyuania xiapuensis]MBY6129075.1 DUF2842 domain-containing protein [Qipengyuania aquimaris]QZD92428.1 DUF2842 domain-containing protein [Qipengyuania xiapuensis]
MREEPTWRIPVGLLGLLVGLLVYGIVIARYLPGLIGDWPTLAQTVVYVFLGLVWLLPLGRFLKWMETGNWR